MAGDPSISGPGDRLRINLTQDHEVRYWTQKLGVTAEQLREAVGAVGPMTAAVEQYFRGGAGKGHWREKSVG